MDNFGFDVIIFCLCSQSNFFLVENQNTNLQHQDGAQDVVLVPQPSKDPEDPLNWGKWRKRLTFFWACWYVFFASGPSSALAPAMLIMEQDLNISLADLNAGNGYLYLFYGLGCLFWQPVAMAYGRRFVLIVSLLLGGVVCNIWLVHVTNSTGLYYANRILMGFFLAPVETLVETVVTDIFFAHERGFYLAFYVFFLGSSSTFCPMAAGFVTSSQGWRWIPYWFAIFSAVGAVGCFFMLEETMYHRATNEVDVNEALGVNTVVGDTEKSVSVLVDSKNNVSVEEGSASEDGSYHIKTYLERLALFNRKHMRPDLFLPSLFNPFIILYKFPPVIFGGFTVASSLMTYMMESGTIAAVLTTPPYNFTTVDISALYVGPTIGVTAVCFAGGWLSDKICLYLARKNQGLREPEYRLYVGLICVVLSPFGIWLWGLGAYYQISWVGLAFAYSISTFTIMMGAAVSYVYVLDCYKEMGGYAIVSVILIRNIVAFTFGYAVTPWITAQGMKNTYLVVGVLALVFWAVCGVMILFGKRLRASTAGSYMQFLEKHGHH